MGSALQEGREAPGAAPALQGRGLMVLCVDMLHPRPSDFSCSQGLFPAVSCDITELHSSAAEGIPVTESVFCLNHQQGTGVSPYPQTPQFINMKRYPFSIMTLWQKGTPGKLFLLKNT